MSCGGRTFRAMSWRDWRRAARLKASPEAARAASSVISRRPWVWISRHWGCCQWRKPAGCWQYRQVPMWVLLSFSRSVSDPYWCNPLNDQFWRAVLENDDDGGAASFALMGIIRYPSPTPCEEIRFDPVARQGLLLPTWRHRPECLSLLPAEWIFSARVHLVQPPIPAVGQPPTRLAGLSSPG